MVKHIGIAACSAEGAALCYRTICLEALKKMGSHAHPEITMHTHPLSEYMRFIDPGDWEGVAELMLSSTRKLELAGAEFVICPDNTIHEAFEIVMDISPLPWLHIAEVVTFEAARRKFQHLAVLGTRYLMEGPVYPDKLKQAGIDYSIPNAAEREKINSIIFGELTNARIKEPSLHAAVRIIDRLKEEGCDAVILGCTELPLLLNDDNSPLPTLDSTRLLAKAALNFSLGE